MRSVFIGACVFAAACSSEGRSGPTSPSSALAGIATSEAQNGSELPFKGNLQANEKIDGALHHVLGSGNATHLGRFDYSAEITVNDETLQGVGTAIWTAANGDQIFASVVGDAVVDFPTVTITETQTITGGTGRFVGASGTIIDYRSLDLLTGITTGSFTGTHFRY